MSQIIRPMLISLDALDLGGNIGEVGQQVHQRRGGRLDVFRQFREQVKKRVLARQKFPK